MNSIPLLDPIRTNVNLMIKLEEAVCSVLRGGKYILGEEVTKFEKTCADYLGVKHAIGVSSGTDALLISLMAKDIGPGDEVICPSFTFIATAGVIQRVGAKPVFVDILPSCFTLDPLQVEKAISSRTKAVIPVHLFGQSADMKAFSILANKYKISIIEDAAQAFGCEYEGQKVGSFGDIGCFSFFPSKNLGGFGDAGLVVTNDDDIMRKLRELRNHGEIQRYVYKYVGGNFRIDTLQAALLNIKLPYLEKSLESRINNASYYFSELHEEEGYILPEQVRGRHTYNQYTLRVKDQRRNELYQLLQENGITSSIYYPVPLHIQECFKDDTKKQIRLPETEKACKEVLSIPVADGIFSGELEYISSYLKYWNQKRRR